MSIHIIYSYKWIVRLGFDIKEISDIFSFLRFLKCGILDNSVILYLYSYICIAVIDGTCICTQVCLFLGLMSLPSFPQKKACLDWELADLAFNVTSLMLCMVFMTTLEPSFLFLSTAIFPVIHTVVGAQWIFVEWMAQPTDILKTVFS